MEARVLKTFSTVLRRFRPDQLVNEAELDGPLTMTDLINRGFLSPGAAPIQRTVAAAPEIHRAVIAEPETPAAPAKTK